MASNMEQRAETPIVNAIAIIKVRVIFVVTVPLWIVAGVFDLGAYFLT
jgi:hypothetical protein